jgi:hypothetical protein
MIYIEVRVDGASIFFFGFDSVRLRGPEMRYRLCILNRLNFIHSYCSFAAPR